MASKTYWIISCFDCSTNRSIRAAIKTRNDPISFDELSDFRGNFYEIRSWAQQRSMTMLPQIPLFLNIILKEIEGEGGTMIYKEEVEVVTLTLSIDFSLLYEYKTV